MKTKVAIVGPGNIGSDLMYKIQQLSDVLEVAAMVGIDPKSDGLARARAEGVTTSSEGIEGLMALPEFEDIEIIFDATSVRAHIHNFGLVEPTGKMMVDLTPAAIGPHVVPAVNLADNLEANNVNMVTCGGQATIPMVNAVSSVVPVHYAEIVASISSKSAGPGTRANIDEFTRTTSRALREVGGAARAKTILILNPAEPPVSMRDTVMMVVDRLTEEQRAKITSAVEQMVEDVQSYVPGYRLKQRVQFEDLGPEVDGLLDEDDRSGKYTRIQIFLEVEGAAMYLPAYAGNLDIITSAAVGTAEAIVKAREAKPTGPDMKEDA